MQVHRQIIDVRETRVVLELPASFVNRRVEIIALTVDEPQTAQALPRRPSPELAAKASTSGGIVSPIVDPLDRTDLA